MLIIMERKQENGDWMKILNARFESVSQGTNECDNLNRYFGKELYRVCPITDPIEAAQIEQDTADYEEKAWAEMVKERDQEYERQRKIDDEFEAALGSYIW